jgi:hypothetical protein
VNEIIKKIKTDLTDFSEKYRPKIQTRRSSLFETLILTPQIETKKKSIKIEFIYLKQPEAVDVRITINKPLQDKENEKHVFVFSNLAKGIEIPIFDSAVNEEIKNLFGYILIDGDIKSSVSALTQAEMFTRIIKDNYNQILNY